MVAKVFSGEKQTNLFSGGGREIRTPGPARVCGFQDRRLKPLGHPSSPEFVPSGPGVVNVRAGFKPARPVKVRQKLEDIAQLIFQWQVAAAQRS